jgi:hypothetical protein
MKKFLLIGTIMLPMYCLSQHIFQEKRRDSLLDRTARIISLDDNQYLITDNPDAIILINIVSGLTANMKDSLQKDSKQRYNDLMKYLSPWKKENIDIAYFNKYTGQNNLAYNYIVGRYTGTVNYDSGDTLQAPNPMVRERLKALGRDEAVRHKITNDGLTIAFELVVYNINRFKGAEVKILAMKYFLEYIRTSYCDYGGMQLYIIDRHTGDNIRYDMRIGDFILGYLTDYHNSLLPQK